MPVHAAPLSRRSFLARGGAVLAGVTVLNSGWASDSFDGDPNVFALLSDTHIPATADISAHDTNMTGNLRQVVREVLADPVRPAVIVNGDCAYLKGLAEDYANFAACVQPLREASTTLHITMGNHDNRERLFEALSGVKSSVRPVESKHVSVIESPHANWFLLDSLTETDVVTGELGEAQRTWLATALAAHSNKPALVMAHHTPQFEPPAEGKVWGGLKDTKEFFELLGDYPHVKAFFYGHSHVWSNTTRGNLKLINLPPVAYVFEAGKPNGWVRAGIRENGISLTLRTIDAKHRQNGERVDVAWG
jgi:3',5'-cyclic AMP phosphodiesterase CpdA